MGFKLDESILELGRGRIRRGRGVRGGRVGAGARGGDGAMVGPIPHRGYWRGRHERRDRGVVLTRGGGGHGRKMGWVAGS